MNTLIQAAAITIARSRQPSMRVFGPGSIGQSFDWARGNFSIVKPEGAGVSALRLDFGSGYRIYFGQDGSEIVILLAGGTKRRQQDDIELAKQLWDEYKKRKKGAPNGPHA